MPTINLKSRFCPSPTGLMHLGNARTALFNALLARGTALKGGNGVFLLRIEDTDRIRSNPLYTQQLQEDLKWLEIYWQEGPYLQSQRHAIYDEYYQQLEDNNQVYPCFCSDEKLALVRKKLISQNRPPRYDGTCRELKEAERSEKLAQGIQPTLRFRVPQNETIEFTDAVRGLQGFHTRDIGDFIIRRADGSASFLFSNAIDDTTMKVTQALRGEDHLSNTPRQLLLLRSLGLPSIQYAHMALITQSDGRKLSKRHGNRSLQEMRAEGFLPAALINYMARLGHRYEQHANDLLSFDALASDFSLGALSTSPAKFDPQQLLYWQKQAVIQLSVADFLAWIGQPIHDLLPESQHPIFVELIKKNIAFPAQALHWASILGGHELHYSDRQIEILKAAETDFFKIALDTLSARPREGVTLIEQTIDFPAWCEAIKDKLNIKGKALFMPLRIALTGEEHGPELLDLCNFLGRSGFQWIKSRLEHAMIAKQKKAIAG